MSEFVDCIISCCHYTDFITHELTYKIILKFLVLPDSTYLDVILYSYSLIGSNAVLL